MRGVARTVRAHDAEPRPDATPALPRARRLPALPRGQLDRQAHAAAADAHALAVGADRQRQAGNVDEAGSRDRAALGRRRHELEAAPAGALHGRSADAHPRCDAIAAGRAAGLRGRRGQPRDAFAVERDVIESVGVDAVRAGAAADGVGDPVAQTQVVVAIATGHVVHAEPCLDHVVARTALDLVVAVTGVDLIIPGARLDHVVAVVARDRVGATARG